MSSPAEPEFSPQLSPQPEPQPWALSPEPEPVLGLRAVFFVFLTLIVSLAIFGLAAQAVASRLPAFRGVSSEDILLDPRVLLPAQLAGYLVIFAWLRRWIGRHPGIDFFHALSWRWPARWIPYVGGGAALGIAVEFVSRWLPAPTDLPIDKMLRTPTDAWLMSLFGVFIAPFAEEVLFRGLLFPALSRRTGAFVALLLTALLFGAVHSEQLGDAWLHVACIAFVGAVLTWVRWRFHSLASATLVHMGYNGLLFLAIFVQTRGFTDLGAR